MEENEIIEKIDKFLDKEGLDIQSKFILTKKISEEYWEEVLSEGEQEENNLLDEVDEGELGEEDTKETEEPEERIAAKKDIEEIQLKELEERKRRILERSKKQRGGRKITIKHPKIKPKKEQKPIEENLEEDELI